MAEDGRSVAGSGGMARMLEGLDMGAIITVSLRIRGSLRGKRARRGAQALSAYKHAEAPEPRR